MKSLLSIACACMTMAGLAPSHAIAGKEADTVGVEIEMLADVRAIAPGTPFRVGVRIVHQPGYHSYWKAPGIVGMPTKIEWNLPEGFAAGDLQWPAPKVVHMFDYKAYGYRGETLLFAEITPPERLDADQPLRLEAQIRWMACARTCHPDMRTFHLDLPVADGPPQAANEALFAVAAATVPRQLALDDLTATALDETLTLRFTVPENAIPADAQFTFIPEENLYDANTPQTTEQIAENEFRVTLPIMPLRQGKVPDAISGLLHHPTGWPQLDGAPFAHITVSPFRKAEPVD